MKSPQSLTELRQERPWRYDRSEMIADGVVHDWALVSGLSAPLPL